MSIRDRLFTRDIANAAAERRERARETAPQPEGADEIVEPTPPPVNRPRESVPVTEPADRVAASAEPQVVFPGEEAGGFRSRWDAIQTGFVDEPRTAVEQADELVAQVMTRLAEVFSEERAQLERQWEGGDKVSTEDLRIALKRYRAFFDRLLSV